MKDEENKEPEDDEGPGLGELDEEVRIGELDNEDLGIDELLDIEDRIAQRIEAFEEESETLSGELLEEQMSAGERKVNLTRKEWLAEALEELAAQKRIVRERLSVLGYDVEEKRGGPEEGEEESRD